MLLPPKYWSIAEFSEGLAKVKVDTKIGYINTKGVKVIPVKYYGGRAFKNGTAVEYIYGLKYGVIDTKGKEIVALKYDELSELSEDIRVFRLDKKYSFLDKNGKGVLVNNYTDASEFRNGFS